ncbi:MAG: DNA cytosine methyltransferase [Tissierellaceae bacterium]|nr:DNA cytosine methyltransferase [Tissierellaceae bacterium]
MKPLAIDLFCGAGGFSEGILQAGFHIVFSSDINEQVEKTYMNRHEQLGLIQDYNTYFSRADIRDLSGEFILDKISKLQVIKGRKFDIDAIFGGPPCQGFSRAGKRQKDDPRNMLFKEYIRVVNEIKPKYVVMENVEGFMDTKLPEFIGVLGDKYEKDEVVPNILISEFDKIGYNTLEPKLLDSSDYGVPQRRKRAIFIAYRKGLTAPTYPEPTVEEGSKITVLDAIGDLIINPSIRKKVNSQYTKYQLDSINGRTLTIEGETIKYDKTIRNHELSKHAAYIEERFALYKEGESTQQLRKRIMAEGINLEGKNKLIELIYKSLDEQYTLAEIKSNFLNAKVDESWIELLLTRKNNRTRLAKDEIASTIVTLPDDYISPFENRVFSVREMARLQSFDDSFVFLGKRTTGGDRRKVEVPQYTQVGNAVPPLLARAIAIEIRNVLI